MNKRIASLVVSCRILVVAATAFWAVPSEAVDGCSFCAPESVVEDAQTYDYSWLKKAVTIQGAAWEYFEESDRFQGAVTMKVGAFNNRKKSSKVNLTFTPMFGKKLTASVELTAEEGELHGFVNIKGVIGTMEVWIWRCEESNKVRFECYSEESSYSFFDADMGGNIECDELVFSMDESSYDILDQVRTANTDVLWEFLPWERTIAVKNGKTLDAGKAYSPQYTKVTDDDGIYYAIVLPTCGGNFNFSGLKLTYTPKTGLIKGSFNIFLTNIGSVPESKKPTLKKVKIDLNGYYLGDGWGMALASVTINREKVCWPVYLYTVWEDEASGGCDFCGL